MNPVSVNFCEKNELNKRFGEDVRELVKKIKYQGEKLRTRHKEELRKLTRLKNAHLVHENTKASTTSVEIRKESKVVVENLELKLR